MPDDSERPQPEDILAAAHDLIHSFHQLSGLSDMIARRGLDAPTDDLELRKTIERLWAMWRRAKHQVFRFEYVIHPWRSEQTTLGLLRPEDVKALIENARQESMTLTRDSSLGYSVHWTTPSELNWPAQIAADPDLLAEALENLLDNARKYSTPGSTVLLSNGVTKEGRPYLAVANTGIPISPDDARMCGERGWRSLIARQVAGGDGLGLWIVKSIMGLHSGELIALPTDASGHNVFLLVLGGAPDIGERQ